MIMVNYEKFLSERFDFVLRYHLLEKVGFDSRTARGLAMGFGYGYMREVFAELLTMDTGDKRVAKALRRAEVFSRDLYGLYYADQLFIDYSDRRFSMKPSHNWLWIEKQIMDGEWWSKHNPFRVTVSGFALDTKRFVLTLIYSRPLYWTIVGIERNRLNLWMEIRYRELLSSDRYGELERSKNRMIHKMEELKFFSIDNYVECEKILKK